MRHVERAAHSLHSHAHFTGQTSAIPLGQLVSPPGSEGVLDVVSVACEAGSMSDWHSHPHGQVLYAVEGRLTAVGRDGVEMLVAPGEAVESSPGEVHRHGSSMAEDIRFLAVTMGGTTWSAAGSGPDAG